MRRNHVPLFALMGLLALGGIAQAAPPSRLDPGIPGAAGAMSVTPRVIRFESLPRIVTPYAGPAVAREEGIFEEAEQQLEAIKRNPPTLPVSEMGQVTIDPNTGGVSAMAPTAGVGFEGITQGGFIPGEPTVAGGPLNIFSCGNVSVTVTNKNGTNRVETNGQTFFGVPTGEGAISDAQCYYDALRGRFLAVAFTKGSNFSFFYLAVSKTSDARGQWWVYKLDQTLDGTTHTTNWSDYEGMGVSDDKLVLSSQQFSLSGNKYQYQKLRVIDRALAYSGGPIGFVDFANFSPPSGGDVFDVFVTKPARNLSAGESTIHCFTVRTNGGSNVAYRTITGPPGAPVLSLGTLVFVPVYAPPPDAPQMGSTNLVRTNDCRPTDFYVRNGVLTVAWHTSADFGGVSVSAIRLFRLRTSDQVVLSQETFGATSTYYYYPAVTVDSVGTIFLGFDRSSSTEFPSSWASGKRRSDASIEPSVLLKQGSSATSQSRWGDFTGVDNDAAATGPSGAVAWYAGQFTKSATVFGTWINKLTFTYGVIAGSVLDDCDGSALTAGDRAPLAGVTLTLKQGATTLGTTTSDASGNFTFGYNETGVYDVVVTPPAGGGAVDVVPGSGGNSQVKINAGDVQVDLTNAQTSSGNQFLVTTPHAIASTTNIAPASKNVGDPGFTMTVNGTGFLPCAVVRLDGADRVTTWLSATQLSASIPASDMAAAGTHSITVFHPAPAGGTSNAQTFTVLANDPTPPVVTVLSPNGGEVWKAGSTHPVTWNATDNVGVTSVDVAYSLDGGATFPGTIATGLANSGSTPWTVPNSPTTGARVRVTAHDAASNAGSDASDASFTIDLWTITATAGANGSISPAGAVGVVEGASQGFSITADTGFHIADVTVDGVSAGAIPAYTFTDVAANHTIAATFAVNTYALTVNVVGGGSVNRVPDQPTYAHGTVVALTPVPATGWAFSGWSGGASGADVPLNLTMVAPITVTATFVDTAGPVVQVLSPNGGEILSAGAVASLQWSATDNAAVTGVDLLLSRTGGGGPFDPIALGQPNSGSYGWSVVGPSTADAFLRVVGHDAAGNTRADVSDAAFTIIDGVAVADAPVTALALEPIAPNPLRGGGRIGFALPTGGHVRLRALDVQGRVVATLADDEFPAGRHWVAWDASRPVALQSGLYFMRLDAQGRTLMRRVALTK